VKSKGCCLQWAASLWTFSLKEMRCRPKAYLLAMTLLAGCDSGDPFRSEKSHGSSDSVTEEIEHAPPSKEEVVEVATSFVLAYLRAYDSEAELDEYFGLIEPEAEFFAEGNSWNVFFAGVSTLNVKLDKDANRGSVRLWDGTAITTDPDMKGKFHPEPIPLFSPSEFREVLKDHVDESESTE
jgi:hypothetical protein